MTRAKAGLMATPDAEHKKGGRPPVPKPKQRRHLLAVMLTDADANAFIEKAYRDCTTVSAQLRVLVTHHLTSVASGY